MISFQAHFFAPVSNISVWKIAIKQLPPVLPHFLLLWLWWHWRDVFEWMCLSLLKLHQSSRCIWHMAHYEASRNDSPSCWYIPLQYCDFQLRMYVITKILVVSVPWRLNLFRAMAILTSSLMILFLPSRYPLFSALILPLAEAEQTGWSGTNNCVSVQEQFLLWSRIIKTILYAFLLKPPRGSLRHLWG